MTGARKTALIAAALFLLNVGVNAPLFLPGEQKYRDSIEGGYASMARFVSEHPNPFGWNPLQYRGLPTHDWYLPVLPYTGAAAIKLLPMLKPEHAYRLIVVTLTCLGPVTLFLFLAGFTRSRRWPALTALIYSLCSVGYLIYPAVKADQGFSYVPWRIQVLVKYGEGPHNVGLMLLPLALLACWRAATWRSQTSVVLAGALLALVTLSNWVAAIALAWCVLMMLLAGAVSRAETGFRGRRLLAAAGLAYLLAAFWLTPRYIGTVFFNWPTDAFGYRVDNLKYVLAAGLAVLPLALAAVFRRRPQQYVLLYLLVCFAGFAWIVSIHYWWRVDIIPEARRYAVEVEMFLFAACGEWLRRIVPSAAGRRRDWTLVTAGFLFAFVSAQPWNYLTRTWIMLRPEPRANTIEYQVAERVAALQPQGRVFAPGGTRFRLNSWFPLQQLGGTFESGLRNRGALHLAYQVQRGQRRPIASRSCDALNMLRAAGAEYAIVHGPGSREHWRDVQNPELVTALLEPVWKEGEDAIYRVPFRDLANFIRPVELPPGIPVGQHSGYIEPYIQAMEDADRPALTTRWDGVNALEIAAPSVPAGMLITLRVSYDGGWRATQDGQPIPIATDYLGNILLTPRASAGPSRVRLHFSGSRQQMAGTLVSLLAAAWCIRAVRRERRRLREA
ncbi:MAG: hypothetical protein FJW31_09000 [Acidobacteria bacterium]|nr:hypothetical protein [Acidobacteriota bacterium]